MRSILIALIAVALVVGYTATPAVAHWAPGDGYKMHYPQMPNDTGWDVNATWPVVLADDWQCSYSGWVKDIHFWGSWRGGIEGTIQSFRISIHANVPGPPSMPGPLLWEREITNFVPTPPIDPPGRQGWYDPTVAPPIVIPNDHDPYFQYNIVDIPNPFVQEEGTIYWLNISAVVLDPVNTQWGWKSSAQHFMDDAVWSLNGVSPWTPMFEPPNFTQTLDLAFVITGKPVPECSDGLDNDADGLIDFPADCGCTDALDNSEAPNPVRQCNDGIDNEGDGKIDMADPDCADVCDNDEGPPPECNDGIDNDADGLIDFPADCGCTDALDNSEAPNPIRQCNDGIDNDGDGKTDMADPDCANICDDLEAPPIPFLSQWGLIALMLVLLAIATWVFFWRRKALRGKVA